MKIGLVCPYSWDIPGGVQSHIRDLAEQLLATGHEVSVLAPGDDHTPGLPEYVVTAGKAIPIPYNGSVARLQFGVVAASRVRRWMRDGEFDVVHVHEPAPPSLSLLACMLSDGPLVATFHSSAPRSRWLSTFDGTLQPFLEKLTGRIAVSETARKMIMEHLGFDAVVIPNGVAVGRFAAAQPLSTLPANCRTDAGGDGLIGFVGRFDEPRKGMDVLLAAMELLTDRRPQLQLAVAGRGDERSFLAKLPASLRGRVTLLGQVDEPTKAAMLAGVEVYCAPNTGGESFGIILLEAMAAGAPVLASDIDAFRRVLDRGQNGELFAVGQPDALADALNGLLADPARREVLARAGRGAADPYDWTVIATQVERVYDLAIAGAGRPS